MFDPIFFIFLMALGVYIWLFKDRLLDLYTNGITVGKPVLDSDYLHIITLTLLTYYPIYSLVSLIFDGNLIEIDLCGVYLYFTLPTLVCGVIYTVTFAPVWYNTLGGDGSASVLGMLVAVMFGAFFATYLAVGLGINTTAIRETFGDYVDMALDVLRLISMMAVLPVIRRFIEYAYQIFKNNLFVALRGAIFSAVGGIVGAGTLLAMIPLFATATVAGIFAGLLLRNNIELVYAPIVSLLAVLGIPPFWHTFYEFMAFGLISASIGMLVYSLIYKQEHRLKYSASGVVVGSLVLLFGAFNEVTVSASVAAVFRNIIDFSPVISNITVSPCYVAAFVVAWIFVFVVAVAVAYMIELVVGFVEEVVVA